MRFQVAVAVGLCCVFAACSLITGADDLEAGDQASSNNNNNNTSSASSTSSSSSSGGTSGATSTSSSGGTSGATSSSSGTSGGTSGTTMPGDSPCKVQHTFCDDFDTGVLGAKWLFSRTSAGMLDLDSTLSVSAPQSLRVRLQPTEGEKEGLLHNETKTDNGEKLLVLDYDLRIDRAPGDFTEINYGVILPFPPPTNIQNHGITILDRGSGASVLQYFRQLQSGNYDSNDVPIVLPKNQWIHVTLTTDFTTTPPVGRVSLNGVPSGQVIMNPTNDLSGAWYEVGANYTLNNKTTTVIHVDNVAFDKK